MSLAKTLTRADAAASRFTTAVTVTEVEMEEKGKTYAVDDFDL